MKRPNAPNPSAARRAFSLFELLIVVGIILILLAIMAPSIAGMIKSNNYSAAINQLSGTLEAARERAISRNKQTAVAVLFDLETERCRLLILDESSDRGDLARLASVPGQDVTVFRPAANSTPVELPEGVMIFGLSTHHILPDGGASTILDGSATYAGPVQLLSEGEATDERGVRTTAWYAGSVVPNADGDELVSTWMAPRNDPRIYFDPRLGMRDLEPPLRRAAQVPLDDVWAVVRDETPRTPGFVTSRDDAVAYVRHAQSFMIRFSPEGSVIALSADTTQADQTGYSYIEFPDGPVAAGGSTPMGMVGEPFDLDKRFDPESLPRDRTLVGQNEPAAFTYDSADTNPEVVLRAASRLAVVDLQDLQRGTGIASPWTLHPTITDADTQAPWPDMFIGSDERPVDNADLDGLVRTMSDWIDRNAVIVDFSRHSGRVMRR